MALPLLASTPGFSQLPPITGGHAGPSTAAQDLGFGTFAPTLSSSFAVGGVAAANSSPSADSSAGIGWPFLLIGAGLVVLLLVLRR